LGNDVSLLQAVTPPLREGLAATRAAGMTLIHTREGHRGDLADCPPAKLNRGSSDALAPGATLGYLLAAVVCLGFSFGSTPTPAEMSDDDDASVTAKIPDKTEIPEIAAEPTR
jgi:hypothetical protein